MMGTISLCVLGLPVCELVAVPARMCTGAPRTHTASPMHVPTPICCMVGENTKFHRDGIFLFTSSHSVDRYQIRKYPYCRISNTPLFSGVLRCYSRGISAARMELGMDFFLRRIMVILDGIFEYSTPKRLAKAQPPTPHELNR